jgi:hypothetical protein
MTLSDIKNGFLDQELYTKSLHVLTDEETQEFTERLNNLDTPPPGELYDSKLRWDIAYIIIRRLVYADFKQFEQSK